MDHNQTIIQWVGNLASVGAIIGAVTGIIPLVAAVIAIVWYSIMIKESDTYRKWKVTRHRRKLARLREQVTQLERSRPPGSADGGSAASGLGSEHPGNAGDLSSMNDERDVL